MVARPGLSDPGRERRLADLEQALRVAVELAEKLADYTRRYESLFVK